MLNVFLAIAVDNLANAQELTAEQEEAEKAAKLEVTISTFKKLFYKILYQIYKNAHRKKKKLLKNVICFYHLPTSMQNRKARNVHQINLCKFIDD